jgi:hypothetical protein
LRLRQARQNGNSRGTTIEDKRAADTWLQVISDVNDFYGHHSLLEIEVRTNVTGYALVKTCILGTTINVKTIVENVLGHLALKRRLFKGDREMLDSVVQS